MKRLSVRYLAALRMHLEQGAPTGFDVARGLGSRAVVIGLETLDFARIHQTALAALILPGCTTASRDDMTRRAAIFFTEAIMPIEETHRISVQASADLKLAHESLDRRTMDLADSNRELLRGITERKAAESALETSGEQSARLLEESRGLQRQLQDMARQILSAQEDERKRMSLTLQNEIAQTLLGIHVRLLALKKDVSVSNEEFQKEIADTQRLVDMSVKTINRLVREFGIQHET